MTGIRCTCCETSEDVLAEIEALEARHVLAEIETCERALTSQIEAGTITAEDRAKLERLIADARRDYAIGLAREEAQALRGVAEPGHIAALETMVAYAETKR